MHLLRSGQGKQEAEKSISKNFYLQGLIIVSSLHVLTSSIVLQHKENANKRKREAKSTKAQQPVKKLKLSNGFIVETCNTSTPSLSNEIATSNVYEQKIKGKKPIKEMNIKKKKHKLGEVTSSQSDVTPQDMLAWAEFQLPDSIMKALTEMGFKQPTKIQQLSLPAAIHGKYLK